MVNMEGNRNLSIGLLSQNRKRGDQDYHGSIPLDDDK